MKLFNVVVLTCDVCSDVDECDVLNGGCQQTCVNTVGSFHCECADDLLLSVNGRTCLGIPGTCSVTMSQRFSIFCHDFPVDVAQCSDVNACKPNEVCVELYGSFMCVSDDVTNEHKTSAQKQMRPTGEESTCSNF